MKKLICLAVAFAALASPAHAGFVPAAVAWVSSTFLVSAATAAAALNFVGGLALSAISTAYQKSRLGKTGGINVSQNIEMGDDLPLSFTLGEFATAGKRKYAGSWGKNTRFLTEVIEFSALPQGLSGIWVNDERGIFVAGQRAWVSSSPGNAGGWSEGATVPGGSIDIGQPLTNLSDDGNRIVVKVLDGTQTAADPFLVAVFGDDEDYPWTADMIGRGKSYAIVTTRYDSDTLTQYPTFLFEPAPLPLYDWRFDSTAGGSGAQRWANRATWQPSRNNAVVAYNIARGIYFGTEWVFGGKNLSAWRFPTAEWTAAANACDQTITLAGGGTQPRYRCGLEVSVDMEPASVMEEIGKAANMKFAEVGGRLKPIVDLPGAAVFGFTDEDILITEGQSFSPFYPVSDTFNAITATYPSRAEKWTSKDAPEYIDTASQVADGGQYLPTSVTFGSVPFARQVQRLMRTQMRDYRRMRRHQFYLPPDAYALEPGIDMVSWTSNRNGYVSKQFMVESVSKTPGLNVLVNLREVDPSDYDWSSDFERPVIITPPVNPIPFIQPINGLTVTPATIQDAGGAARRPAIQVSCTGDETGVTHIQIEARRAGAAVTVIDTERAFNEPFLWYLQSVLPLTTYEVRARLISNLTPRSAWSSWLTVTTPDVRLSTGDVRMDEITAEVLEDLASLFTWVDGTGDVIRGLMDNVAGIRDLIAEQDFANLLARQDIRQSLAVEVGAARAAFDERITVVIADNLAQSVRVSSLTASLRGTAAAVSREEIARATADSALAASITALSAVVDGKASSTALTALTTRVDTAEGNISAQGSAITVIETALPGKASTSSVNTLTGRVDDIEGEISAQAEAITSVTARTNRGTANGLLRISAESTPAGVTSRIGLRAEATAAGIAQTAALFLEATAGGDSQVLIAADRFALATGNGPGAPRRVPFIVDGGIVYIDEAFIRNAAITNAMIANAQITSAKIGDLEVERIKIANGSVSSFERAFTSGAIGVSVGNYVSAQQLSYTVGRTGPQVLFIAFSYVGAIATHDVRVIRTQGGSSTTIFQGEFTSAISAKDFNQTIADTANISGAVTYGLEVRVNNSTAVATRFLGALNVFK